jgi:uncharacterized protein YjbI with pentapeptide repeats
MQNVFFANLNVSTCAFEFVDFSEAKLMGTNFFQARSGYRIIFRKADLSNTNLSYTRLYYAEFQDALLKNTILFGADLHLADFSGANLEGAIFDEANLYAALFTDVKGIDDTQRKSLEGRAATWLYDLEQSFYELLHVLFSPSFLLITAAAILFSVIGLRSKETKTRLFGLACGLNGFALFSTFSTLQMMFSGGHPVMQMSGGNYAAWSAWFHFFPFPMLGLMICVPLAFGLVIYGLVLVIRKQNNTRPWKLFWYLILTLAHCLLAFNWLLIFMPDA